MSVLCRMALFFLLLSMALSARANSPASLPDSCTVDFSSSLEKPAGQNGFLRTGSDGHFYWKNGKRARFWGINISSTRLNIPDDAIERTVQTLARAGLNLVRLEAIDNRDCLLGGSNSPGSRRLDPVYLDRLDRWMDSLRRHGIYYYLDLLDFRTFRAGDGVLNAELLDRGARPYAIYDRYLIALQKEYAQQLLLHRNPYSKLRPVEDPALAMVELCNEHGFFLYPEKLESLAEPYRSDLKQRWNRWLVVRYGTRAEVDKAWGRWQDWSVLRPEEDPTQETVAGPSLIRTPEKAPLDMNGRPDVRPAPARLRDTVIFLTEIQRAYIRELRADLQQLGLRIPITAVFSANIIPDISSVAEEADFMAENWYGDSYTDDPRYPGKRYYSSRNPLSAADNGGFAPYTAALRWNHKPVVVREWAVSWPNPWRAVSVPEALAYASLQDHDAVLLFGYQTNRAPNGSQPEALNDFAFQSDPTVWGLYALAGQAFLSRAVKPAEHQITLAYPPELRLDSPFGLSELHRLAYSVRLNSSTARTSGSIQPTNDWRDLRTMRRILETSWKGKKLTGRSFAEGEWRSDTGEILRKTRQSWLEIRSPRLRVLAGAFKPGKIYNLGNGYRFSTPSSFGALLLFSLDDLPIGLSHHLAVKMVTRAENTDQQFERSQPGSAAEWTLSKSGKAPVRTLGTISSAAIHLWIQPQKRGKLPIIEKQLLTLFMRNGTWELVLKDGGWVLTCDTPGINGLALGRSFTTGIAPLTLTPEVAERKEPLHPKRSGAGAQAIH